MPRRKIKACRQMKRTQEEKMSVVYERLHVRETEREK